MAEYTVEMTGEATYYAATDTETGEEYTISEMYDGNTDHPVLLKKWYLRSGYKSISVVDEAIKYIAES